MKPKHATAPPVPTPASQAEATYVQRHLRFGWWSLLVFLSLGLVLESLDGLKIGWYLEMSNITRRLMWTLGYAHGALLGLVHLGFAASLPLLPGWKPNRLKAASLCL